MTEQVPILSADRYGYLPAATLGVPLLSHALYHHQPVLIASCEAVRSADC